MSQLIENRLRVAGLSDVGLVRSLNEDSYAIDPELGLLVVADGMGGHEAGEVASKMVIEAIRTALGEGMAMPFPEDTSEEATITLVDSPHEATIGLGAEDPTLDDLPNPILATITDAVHFANQQVNEQNQERGYPDGMGMGSTLVGMWLPEYSDDGVLFHVGDSRAYLFRQGRLSQVTQDHTLYQQWANFGGTGEAPAKNILIQAMGPSSKVVPDVRFQNLRHGDLLLFCSDGLTGMISDDQIAAVLRGANERNLDDCCQRLIDGAKRGGGKDNITVILGYVL